MNPVLRSILYAMLGTSFGIFLTASVFVKASNTERHMLYHAYRLGCKENSGARLSECEAAAASYQLSIEMLMAQLGLYGEE
nr:hypothetical protein BdHM001_34920 [Bdellovibrio sp. HM001]